MGLAQFGQYADRFAIKPLDGEVFGNSSPQRTGIMPNGQALFDRFRERLLGDRAQYDPQTPDDFRCVADVIYDAGRSTCHRLADDVREPLARQRRETKKIESIVYGTHVVDLAGPMTAGGLNPVTYVTKDDAPTLILHGTADTDVSTKQSQMLVSALKVACVFSMPQPGRSPACKRKRSR